MPLTLKATSVHYKNRGIALYIASILLLSVLVFSLNNASTSTVAYGANPNDVNSGNNNNEVNNHLSINDISGQIAGSNTDIDKERVLQVLQQIQAQIALAAGEDEATKAIDQLGYIVHLNPRGELAQSLSFLAKQQEAGNTDAVKQVAMKVADHISSGDDDLGKSFAQDVEQSSETQLEKSSGSPALSSLTSSPSSPNSRTESDQSIMEGIGEEPDTDEKEANALNKGGGGEPRTLSNNIVVPDDTAFKSNECDGSLDKFVPNPFIKSIGSTRFLVQDCVTVVGKVTWTHYINTDGDANFNIKLDSKYSSLLTPANNSPTFKGALHVEVVCQGPNKSKDPIKVDQCKNPKYDGPKFRLPKVGTRVQVTGTYLLDINEGGHAEVHPAYKIVFNPTTKGTIYQTGYDHGCSDAKLPSSKRYINQPGKGPESHSQEFMSGYNAGFSACSTK
jgi:hypothetical protein